MDMRPRNMVATVRYLQKSDKSSKDHQIILPSVARIARSHHVLGVEHLLGELGDGESSVLLGSAGSEGSESGHEEVEAGEGNLKGNN